MKKLIYTLFTITLFISCGGGGSGGGTDPAPDPDPAPGSISLNSPSQNEVCVGNGTGSVITQTIQWSSAQFASSYNLSIFGSDGTTHVSGSPFTITGTSKSVNLAPGKAYSYKVTAVNPQGSSNSATWPFTTKGVATVNSVPQATTSIDIDNDRFSISFSDNDGDAMTYDVYISSDAIFDTNELVATNVSVTDGETKTIENIGLTDESLWFKVVTTDAYNNRSVSFDAYLWTD
ncbi:MAG: hypothetical protein COB60_02060 [Flavobacteriaceae bacterium]|nr:MAG: hypothetical protein COB60_02060 [Flavobacteriaceae bacterium]